MATRMLIDAMHTEETRVVALKGNRLEEFDYESASKKQLKGSIYLAKVTRVEPSLQAAFVDYGGNRHGFLAFNEIHPDYYQIPVADREALLQEEAEQAAQEAALDDAAAEAEAAGEEAEDAEAAAPAEDAPDRTDILEDEMPRPRTRSRRQYKIQEVIKKRQILLVQVVKEERGTKGAALTTYLSLAGRYCVLMPNTARGGGISRKIANQSARRKLKKIVSELDVPEGMGVIVRTAGQSRTKSEIRRDLDYLLRLWDSVRELTLVSTAPTMVYEEASLIKRAIRDVYTKDVEEILVEGEEGYRVAKDFMRLLMPSHAKKVQPYRNRIPLFHRYQVEQQLDTMHSNIVHLRSGGYLVINQTEALVAVDVNSGRSTKERNIEETALKTNLEASEEVARQLRLRDLAGLVVIDYIDMEEPRNNRSVERRLKECLKSDRARIQVGRISSFGLLEMSRQRLRPSLFEASSVPCTHCGGVGYVRSTESTALQVLRAIEEEGIRGRAGGLLVHAPASVALYILNQKRDALIEIEARYGIRVSVLADEALIVPNFNVELDSSVPVQPREGQDDVEVVEASEDKPDAEAGKKRRRRRGRRRGDDRAEERTEEDTVAADAEAQDADEESDAASAKDEDESDRPKRRRRGRRGGRRRRQSEETEVAAADADGESEAGERTDGEATNEIAASEANEVEIVSEEAAAADASQPDVVAELPQETVVSDGETSDAIGEADDAAVSTPEQTDEAVTVVASVTAEATNERPSESDTDVVVAEASADTQEVAAAPSSESMSVESGAGAETAESPDIDGSPDPQPQAATDATVSVDMEPVEAEATGPSSNDDSSQEQDHATNGEAAAAETEATEPVEDEQEPAPQQSTEPKRRGWWQRRSIF